MSEPYFVRMRLLKKQLLALQVEIHARYAKTAAPRLKAAIEKQAAGTFGAFPKDPGPYAKYGIGESTQQASRPGAESSLAQVPKGEIAVVWKLRADKSLEPAEIAIGITDHAYTEVLSVVKGDLNVDDSVVTASVAQGSR
jgi:hypothetical protein